MHTQTHTHTCCSDGWARYVEMSQVASLKATTASKRVSDDWDMMPTCQRDIKQPRLNPNPTPLNRLNPNTEIASMESDLVARACGTFAFSV